MKENEIKKAMWMDMLGKPCVGCPYKHFDFPKCRQELFYDISGLMNSKSAEIEYYKQIASQRKPVSNMENIR